MPFSKANQHFGMQKNDSTVQKKTEKIRAFAPKHWVLLLGVIHLKKVCFVHNRVGCLVVGKIKRT